MRPLRDDRVLRPRSAARELFRNQPAAGRFSCDSARPELHKNSFSRKTVSRKAASASVSSSPATSPGRKARAIILRLKELDVENRLEFHILGEAVNELRSKRFAKSIIIHGGYERDQFAARVARINPVISVIFSIWPETWCHTLTESWSAGLPVAAFDLGAVGRRLQRECRRRLAA